MSKFVKTLLASVAILTGAAPALADPIITSFTPTDTFIGGGFFVGYQFTANSDLSLSALGFYDDGQDGLASSHTVGVFDLSGTLLGSVVVGPGSETLVGDFEYANLASPIALTSGTSYRIGGTTDGDDVWVFQGTDLVTNGVTYNGSYFNSANTFGPLDTAAPERQYFTVNALTGVPGVPEPATWAMMLLGFGAIGIAFRRTRNFGLAASYA